MQLGKTAILIAGPTASGKSSLALTLAAAFDGVIINADSMQVYRDLNILTARPPTEDLAEAPHRLYGYLDGSIAGSVAQWVGDAMQEIVAAWSAGKTPILVGGTGLYFKALLSGYAEMPKIDADIRADVRALVTQEGAPAAHVVLQAVDPQTAIRLHPNDSQRIARALEIFRSTGQSITDLQAADHIGPLVTALKGQQPIRIKLGCDRNWLYARCDQRLDAMIATGGLEELAVLLERGLDHSLPVMRSLGVPQLAPVIQDGAELGTCLDHAKQETRRFAKRQLTWLRNQFPDWALFPVPGSADNSVNFIRKLSNNN